MIDHLCMMRLITVNGNGLTNIGGGEVKKKIEIGLSLFSPCEMQSN